MACRTNTRTTSLVTRTTSLVTRTTSLLTRTTSLLTRTTSLLAASGEGVVCSQRPAGPGRRLGQPMCSAAGWCRRYVQCYLLAPSFLTHRDAAAVPLNASRHDESCSTGPEPPGTGLAALPTPNRRASPFQVSVSVPSTVSVCVRPAAGPGPLPPP